MLLVETSLAHERMCDRHFERLGKRGELGGGARGQHAAAHVD